ncbi:carbohydrate kinase [Dokdonella sp.]|uniref:carbohydrate kinase family protein n=1 Tax=Dokdonella sp. TaxID=2291710 RepID=UPI003529313E
MKAVVCFGEALIDFQPIGLADTSPSRSFQQHAGGAPANVAVAVARLGGRAEFVGTLGTDMFGDFLLDSLQGAGVGTRHIQRTGAAPTALAFVAHDARGERSFSFYRGPAADLLFRENRLSASVFDDASVFHACSNSLTEEGIARATLACQRRAREAGVLVSFDMNLRPALWPQETDPAPRIRSALALADVVKLSVEELAFLAESSGSEEAALREIWTHHAELVIVTDAERPVRWHTRNANGSMEAFVVDAVDTTAAGDAFTGGLLFMLANQASGRDRLMELLADVPRFENVLRFAAGCGALAVTRRGAFAAMPSSSEVNALLRRDEVLSMQVASS